MTSKSDFSAEEWQLILEAPPSAGMIVVTAQRGGTFRETIAMAKAQCHSVSGGGAWGVVLTISRGCSLVVEDPFARQRGNDRRKNVPCL
jgi:hypothetical protein